jgi:hypothetical protein
VSAADWIVHARIPGSNSLTDLDNWEETFGRVGSFPPAFAWPADHRWCFASDVDPHWAGIGADRAVINSLRNTLELDVVPAQPTEPQPTYYESACRREG